MKQENLPVSRDGVFSSGFLQRLSRRFGLKLLAGVLLSSLALALALTTYRRAPVLSLKNRFTYTPIHSDFPRHTGLSIGSLMTPSDVSRPLILAILTNEDGNFLRHHGFDWFEMGRAVEDFLLQGRRLRGASTISQQLIKNVFLSGSRSMSRKVVEAIYTIKLERCFTKNEILTLYLDVAQFGVSTFGIGEAARHYFDEEPGQLTLEKAAILAFLLPNPEDREEQLRTGKIKTEDRENLWIVLFKTHAALDYVQAQGVHWRNGMPDLQSVSFSEIAEKAADEAPSHLISAANASLDLIEREHYFRQSPEDAPPSAGNIPASKSP